MPIPFHRRPYRMEREAREVLNMFFQGPNPDAFNAYREMQIKSQAQSINQLQTAFLNAQNPDVRFAYQQTQTAAQGRVNRVSAWNRGQAPFAFGAQPPVGGLWAYPRSPARIAQDARDPQPILQPGTRERMLRDRAEQQRNQAGYQPYQMRPSVPPNLYTSINVTGLSPYGPERTYPIADMRQQRIERRQKGDVVIERTAAAPPPLRRAPGEPAIIGGRAAARPRPAPAPVRPDIRAREVSTKTSADPALDVSRKDLTELRESQSSVRKRLEEINARRGKLQESMKSVAAKMQVDLTEIQTQLKEARATSDEERVKNLTGTIEKLTASLKNTFAETNKQIDELQAQADALNKQATDLDVRAQQLEKTLKRLY